MTRSLLPSVATAVVCAAILHAQARPDFSGTWVEVGPNGSGSEIRVQQTAATLSTGHASTGDDHVFAYRLDGTETRNAIASHGSEIVSVSKAEWTGAGLIIAEETTYPDGRRVSRKQTWSLNEKGQLVIELVTTAASGEPQKFTVTYTRKATIQHQATL
jgi:hypothetical protein